MSVKQADDFSDLKDKSGSLTEEDHQRIQEAAMKEIEAEEAKARGEKEPEVDLDDEDEPKKDDEETPQKGTEDESDDKGEKDEKDEKDDETDEDEKPSEDDEEEEARIADEDALLEKDRDELSEEDQKRYDEITKRREEAAEAEIAEEARLISKAEGISEDEARKMLEGEQGIIKKYQNNPKKLARAYRHMQSQFDQAIANAKKLQEQNSVKSFDPEKEIVIEGKRMTYDKARPTMIQTYRNENPDSDLSDDEIFEKTQEQYQTRVREYLEKQQKEVGDKAVKKRASLLLDLPDDVKPYKDEVESLLNNASDGQVLQDDYEINDLVYWVRGKHSDDIIKAAEKRGYKRGLENRKIVGRKQTENPEGGKTGGAGSTGGQKTGKTTVSEILGRELTDTEKNDALNAFESTTVWTEEEKYAAWAEVLAEEKKKK